MTDSVSEEMLLFERRAIGRGAATATPAQVEHFDLLFRRHYTSLLRLAVVMLGSREAAEDVVQDAFVALHRNWSKLRDPEAAEAYLRSAVLNGCRTWVRRRVREQAPRPLRLLVEARGPEDTTVVRDEVGALVARLRTLPRRQREVLACRHVLDLSVAETAQLLGVSEGSVKTHTHRGLQALQQGIEVNP